jgi:hypothetical protein
MDIFNYVYNKVDKYESEDNRILDCLCIAVKKENIDIIDRICSSITINQNQETYDRVLSKASKRNKYISIECLVKYDPHPLEKIW